MAALDDLLRQVAARGGSALHLADGRPPRLRLHGTLTSLSETGRDEHLDVGVQALVEKVAPKPAWEAFLSHGASDFCHELQEAGTFHVHVFRREGGTAAVIRHRPPAATFEERALPAMLKGLTRVSGGLVLATGPKGAGKSMTLHAMIAEIDSRLPAHVVTVEDPMQLVLAPSQVALSQRQVGLHTKSIASGITEAMAIGADVIYASRLPDAASIDAAFAAADGGALVLAAVVADGVVRGLENLVERYPKERRAPAWRRLSHTLRGATSQVLLPCQRDTYRGRGQHDRRRCPAVEVLVNGRAFTAAIRQGDTEALRQLLERSETSQTLDEALIELIRAGRVRPEDAHDHARDKARVARARPGVMPATEL